MAMAELCDDLEELCGESDELSERFTRAANHLQSLLPTVDSETLLQLYGLYKQGLQGPCTASKPSWYDVKGKSKWEAWKKLGDLPSTEAKKRYIERIESLDTKFESESDVGSKDAWVKVSTMLQDEDDIHDQDKTPSDYVKEGNVKKIEEALKQSKLDVNSIDEDGLGLIHWAADRGSLLMLKTLLKHNADVNLRDVDGQTCLHYAVSCGHQDCVRFLLESGCDPHAADSDGSLPIDLANESLIKEILAEYR